MSKSKSGKRANENNKRADVTNDIGVSRWDNVRLIAGFAFVIFGAFLACSIISYFFYWKEDMSAINEVNPRIDVVYSNICGPMGARVAQKFVGGGFGIFALALPVYTTILGWRLFRFKPLRLHRLTLISALVIIMGSLTLGAFFDTNWALFGSGIGGGYGVALSNWLTAHVGFVGTLLLIVVGWIATGIIINRNFLQLLGNWCVEGYEKCSVAVQGRVAKWRQKRAERRAINAENETEVETEDEESVEEPVVEPEATEVETAEEAAPIFTVEKRDESEEGNETTEDTDEEFENSAAANVSDTVNDAYLKLNGNEAGSESYSLVVELAVAYYCQ